MALKFESNGTCLIVKQYLDRSREVLRQELLEKVSELLVKTSAPLVKNNELQSTDGNTTLQKVNTF
jgi:hypothetical protein